MRKGWVLAVGAVVTAVAFVAGWSTAAVKQYQFTGEVMEFDAKAKTLSVKKGDETWEFSTEGLKDLKAKKGDRLTVYYSMLVKKVEAK
jgi:hypothetical protein